MIDESIRPDAPLGFRTRVDIARFEWQLRSPSAAPPGTPLRGGDWSKWTAAPVEGAPDPRKPYGPEYKRPGPYGPGHNNRGGQG